MADLQPDLHLRLTRYLSGGCSAAEAAGLERWLRSEPAAQAELEALRKLWEASARLPSTDRVDEMWADVARQIRGSAPAPSKAACEPAGADADAVPVVSRRVLTLHRAESRWRAWRWVVAGIAAAGLVATVVYGGRDYRGSDAMPGTATAEPAGTGAVREYRTQRGQRRTIHLGDGTRIELGVASVLRVYRLTDRRRDVELEGEAVFDVVHDPVRPFTVRSRNALIEDLGTRFNVRAYRDDAQVRVVVAQGKVALRPGGDWPDTTAVLVPGDLGTIDHQGRTQVRRVDAEGYFGWTAGRLGFDNATLAEVAADLRRWYDVDVTMTPPSLAAHRVSVNMPIGSLTDALDAIAAPLGLAYTRHGTTVVLRAK